MNGRKILGYTRWEKERFNKGSDWSWLCISEQCLVPSLDYPYKILQINQLHLDVVSSGSYSTICHRSQASLMEIPRIPPSTLSNQKTPEVYEYFLIFECPRLKIYQINKSRQYFFLGVKATISTVFYQTLSRSRRDCHSLSALPGVGENT